MKIQSLHCSTVNAASQHSVYEVDRRCGSLYGSLTGWGDCSLQWKSRICDWTASCLGNQNGWISLLTSSFRSDIIRTYDINTYCFWLYWWFSVTITFTGIARSINPRDTLSVLSSSENQDCLRDRHQRSPILFGVDFVSGCMLRWDMLTLSFFCRYNVSFIPLLILQIGERCQLLPGLANYVECSERI